MHGETQSIQTTKISDMCKFIIYEKNEIHKLNLIINYWDKDNSK